MAAEATLALDAIALLSGVAGQEAPSGSSEQKTSKAVTQALTPLIPPYIQRKLDPSRVKTDAFKYSETDPREVSATAITQKVVAVRKVREEEALKASTADTVQLVAGDGTQSLFSAISMSTAFINVIKPSILDLKHPTLVAKVLNTAVGGFQVLSGICMVIVGIQEIKSALSDLRASGKTSQDPALQGLEVFKTSKNFQNIRLAMGILDLVCGIAVMAIGVLTILSIFGILGASPLISPILAVVLTSVLLLPSIAPLHELRLKISARHNKTDIGSLVGMADIKKLINEFDASDSKKLDLSKRLAKTIFVIYGFDKDHLQDFNNIDQATDPAQVIAILNEVFSKFNPKQLCELEAKVLEYLKSRVGEEAARELLAAVVPMTQLLRSIPSLTKENFNKKTWLEAINIDKIESYISDWNKAVNIRFGVQLLYVASFLISTICCISGMPINVAELAQAAPWLSAAQSIPLFCASIIPLWLDAHPKWRWLRGAPVVADAVELEAKTYSAEKKIEKLQSEMAEIEDLAKKLFTDLPKAISEDLQISKETEDLLIQYMQRLLDRKNAMDDQIKELNELMINAQDEEEKDALRQQKEQLQIAACQLVADFKRSYVSIYQAQIKHLELLIAILTEAKNANPQQTEEIDKFLPQIQQLITHKQQKLTFLEEQIKQIKDPEIVPVLD